MSSHNTLHANSIENKARTILMELAHIQESTLEPSDVNTIMSRLDECGNGNSVCKLIAGSVSEREYSDTNKRQSLEAHSLFYVGELENGFEKAMEIVRYSKVTKPQSYAQWTDSDTEALRAEMEEIDRSEGVKRRYEDTDTWKSTSSKPTAENDVNNSLSDENSDDGGDNDNPQNLDAVDMGEPSTELDQRNREFKSNLL